MKPEPSSAMLEFSVQSSLVSCFKTLIYGTAAYILFTIGGVVSYALLIPVGFYLVTEGIMSVVSLFAVLIVIPIERAYARKGKNQGGKRSLYQFAPSR
jgi:hypothetical protein